MIERYNTAVEDLGVDGTPRIFINGDLFTRRPAIGPTLAMKSRAWPSV